ncbi:MAG TPA: hypothetical protein VIV60_21530 [Polyangiaceae bacterium]
MMKLSERERRVLVDLEACDVPVTPLMIGGSDGSHHSATLNRLVAKGLVERKKYHAIYCFHGTEYPPRSGKIVKGCCCKGSCKYKLK